MVQRTQERSSWASLPEEVVSALYASPVALPLVLEVRPAEPPARGAAGAPRYVAWGGAAAPRGRLGLPAALADALGLREGAAVTLRALPAAPAAAAVSVEPAGADDWEVVELNAGYVEEQLLGQAGVAAPGQPLLLWVRGALVTLSVLALDPPAPAAALGTGTEVHVAPRVRVRDRGGGAAASGPLDLSLPRGQSGGGSRGGGGDSRPPAAMLRVQSLGRGAAAALAAAGGGDPPPRSVLRAYLAPETLARVHLSEGDWAELLPGGGVGGRGDATPGR